jgi:hypothetical protein
LTVLFTSLKQIAIIIFGKSNMHAGKEPKDKKRKDSDISVRESVGAG